MLDLKDLQSWISANELDSLPVAVASVHEPGGELDKVRLLNDPFAEPTLLVLASYETVQWELVNEDPNMAGVVVFTYAPGSRVNLLGETPVVYINDYLDLPFDLEHDFYSLGVGRSHCESRGMVDLDKAVQANFGAQADFFTGDYGPEGLVLPGTTLDEDTRSSFSQAYEGWVAEQNQAEEKRTFKNRFDF